MAHEEFQALMFIDFKFVFKDKNYHPLTEWIKLVSTQVFHFFLYQLLF